MSNRNEDHEMIRIELDSIRKFRNAQEYRTINRARIGSLESIGDGDNIAAVARMALDSGDYSPDQMALVARGKLECSTPQTLLKWASAKTGREMPEHLKKHREVSA